MWKTLSKMDARNEFNKWDKDKEPKASCDENYLDLRKKLLDAHEVTNIFLDENESNTKKRDYLYDLRFGIEIYRILNTEYNFTTRLAANDQIWIYLQMKVIPDLVFNRWGFSETRFYQQSRRLWLKTIWWYIHLSWNNNEEETYKILRRP